MILNIERGAEAILKFVEMDGEQDLQWKSKVLKSSFPQTRTVVQYSFFRRGAVSDSQPFLHLIGKFYADESGRQIYQVMQALHSSLFRTGASPLLTIPHPLFYDPDSRVIVQQYAGGIPYNEILDHHNYPKYFRLLGRALAFLHARDVPIGEKKSIHDHLKELIHPHPMRFCEELPQYRHLVEELIKEMGKRERQEKIEVSPIHRDFHLRQLFYGEGQVWLIDWDLFAKGDPALDVGNFIVYLKTHLTKECAPAIEAFLEGYCSAGPSAILNRTYLYEALTYLRLACKRLRLRGCFWKIKVKDMLVLSERCLMKESI